MQIVCKCPCFRTVIPPPFFWGMVKTLDADITVIYGTLSFVSAVQTVSLVRQIPAVDTSALSMIFGALRTKQNSDAVVEHRSLII